MSRFIDSANRIDKSDLYETYFRLYFDDLKNYESITRKKMAELLIKKYTPDFILNVCTSRELKYLKNILENRDPLEIKDSCLFEKEALEQKKICVGDEIWDEFKEPIQQTLKMVDWEKKEKEDEILSYLIGMIKVVGIADVMLVEAFAKAICENDEDKATDILGNHPMFQYYTIFTDAYRNEKGFLCPVFIHHDYLEETEYITEQRNDYELVTPKFYDAESYSSFFYNDYDETKPEIKEFFELLQKDNLYKSYKCFFLTQSQYLLEDDFIEMKLLPEKYISVWKKIKDQMPSPILRGMCPKDYQVAVEKRTKMENLKDLNQRQVNATLSQKEAKMFYKYFYSVLSYTNKKYQIYPSLSIEPGYSFDLEKLREIIDIFWDHKDEIIDEYIRINPLRLTYRALNQIREFKNGIRDTFVLYRYEKKYSIFILEENVYMVKGLYDNLEKLIPARQLPVLINTTILPFANTIVVDGIVSQIPVKLGPNQIEHFENSLQTQSKIYTLVTKQ